ncbi:MAG: hypothetical protein QNJ31_09540 [Candidatus Caenarcaniphilales bacterium]|nr:hypothetical protein [Candidatus Caenarcaniphilales bacterium]
MYIGPPIHVAVTRPPALIRKVETKRPTENLISQNNQNSPLDQQINFGKVLGNYDPKALESSEVCTIPSALSNTNERHLTVGICLPDYKDKGLLGLDPQTKQVYEATSVARPTNGMLFSIGEGFNYTAKILRLDSYSNGQYRVSYKVPKLQNGTYSKNYQVSPGTMLVSKTNGATGALGEVTSFNQNTGEVEQIVYFGKTSRIKINTAYLTSPSKAHLKQ